MKKSLVFALPVAVVLILGSCKAKESAYKAAYEKAQQREIAEAPMTPEEQEVVKPVSNPASGAVERTEKLTAVNPSDASGLKLYNVVVGSFKNKTNATALKEMLQRDGYSVILAQNAEGMYRVVASSYDNRQDATAAREEIKSKYPNKFNDAWLLINQ